jgi:hypothetical protein
MPPRSVERMHRFASTAQKLRNKRIQMNIALRTLSTIAAVVASSLLVACNKAPPPPPYKPIGDMKAFMNNVLEPSAQALWATVGSISTKDGVENFAPKTDEDWAKARHYASVVAESGNLLMMEGRAKDREAWTLAARGLIDQAEVALKAIEKKDADALFTANSDVFLACTECHSKYVVGALPPAGK